MNEHKANELIVAKAAYTQRERRFLTIVGHPENRYLSYDRETARSLICFRLTSSVIRKILH